MGETTDKAAGRLKQATGALTGDDRLKHEGETQEHKGQAKEKVNEAVDKAKDKLDELRDKAGRA